MSDRANIENFNAAQDALEDIFGEVRPAGGFFLWLDVGDGEAAAKALWAEAAVKVLPGGYMARPDATVQSGCGTCVALCWSRKWRRAEGMAPVLARVVDRHGGGQAREDGMMRASSATPLPTWEG
jgi:DNA-binding transcriptional MocR family regulator